MSFPQNIKSFSPLTGFDMKRLKQLCNGFTTRLWGIFGGLKPNKIKAFTGFIRRIVFLLRIFSEAESFFATPLCSISIADWFRCPKTEVCWRECRH